MRHCSRQRSTEWHIVVLHQRVNVNARKYLLLIWKRLLAISDRKRKWSISDGWLSCIGQLTYKGHRKNISNKAKDVADFHYYRRAKLMNLARWYTWENRIGFKYMVWKSSSISIVLQRKCRQQPRTATSINGQLFKVSGWRAAGYCQLRLLFSQGFYNVDKTIKQ